MIYWVVLALVALFFVLAMIIYHFQNSFEQMRKEADHEAHLFRRTGIAAAFILMDEDNSNSLEKEECLEFFKSLRPNVNEKQANTLFTSLNTNKEDNKIDVKEFVEGVEKMKLINLLLRDWATE